MCLPCHAFRSALPQPSRHLPVVIQDGIAADPIQCWHVLAGRSKECDSERIDRPPAPLLYLEGILTPVLCVDNETEIARVAISKTV